MHKGCHEDGDDSNDCQYRCGDAAKGSTQLPHDSGSGAHSCFHFADSTGQLHKALHGHTDFGDGRTDDHKERCYRSD